MKENLILFLKIIISIFSFIISNIASYKITLNENVKKSSDYQSIEKICFKGDDEVYAFFDSFSYNNISNLLNYKNKELAEKKELLNYIEGLSELLDDNKESHYYENSGTVYKFHDILYFILFGIYLILSVFYIIIFYFLLKENPKFLVKKEIFKNAIFRKIIIIISIFLYLLLAVYTIMHYIWNESVRSAVYGFKCSVERTKQDFINGRIIEFMDEEVSGYPANLWRGISNFNLPLYELDDIISNISNTIQNEGLIENNLIDLIAKIEKNISDTNYLIFSNDSLRIKISKDNQESDSINNNNANNTNNTNNINNILDLNKTKIYANYLYIYSQNKINANSKKYLSSTLNIAYNEFLETKKYLDNVLDYLKSILYKIKNEYNNNLNTLINNDISANITDNTDKIKNLFIESFQGFFNEISKLLNNYTSIIDKYYLKAVKALINVMISIVIFLNSTLLIFIIKEIFFLSSKNYYNRLANNDKENERIANENNTLRIVRTLIILSSLSTFILLFLSPIIGVCSNLSKDFKSLLIYILSNNNLDNSNNRSIYIVDNNQKYYGNYCLQSKGYLNKLFNIKIGLTNFTELENLIEFTNSIKYNISDYSPTLNGFKTLLNYYNKNYYLAELIFYENYTFTIQNLVDILNLYTNSRGGFERCFNAPEDYWSFDIEKEDKTITDQFIFYGDKLNSPKPGQSKILLNISDWSYKDMLERYKSYEYRDGCLIQGQSSFRSVLDAVNIITNYISQFHTLLNNSYSYINEVNNNYIKLFEKGYLKLKDKLLILQENFEKLFNFFYINNNYNKTDDLFSFLNCNFLNEDLNIIYYVLEHRLFKRFKYFFMSFTFYCILECIFLLSCAIMFVMRKIRDKREDFEIGRIANLNRINMKHLKTNTSNSKGIIQNYKIKKSAKAFKTSKTTVSENKETTLEMINLNDKSKIESNNNSNDNNNDNNNNENNNNDNNN